MSNAERQRKYRQRHLKEPDGEPLVRLNLLASANAKAHLERLSSCYAVTLRAALERAIHDASDKVMAGLSGEDKKRYLDRTLRRNEPSPPLQSNATNETPLHRNEESAPDEPLHRNEQDAALQGNKPETTREPPLHRNALSDRDARILELAGLSEVKVAEILNAEGIKCSPRTAGNVRKRFSEGKL